MSVSTIIDRATGKIYDSLYDKTVIPNKGFAKVSSETLLGGVLDQVFLENTGAVLVRLSLGEFASRDNTIIHMEENDVIKFMKTGFYKVEVRLNVKLEHPPTEITIPKTEVGHTTVSGAVGEFGPIAINYPPQSHNFQVQFFTKGTVDIHGIYVVGHPVGEGAFIGVNFDTLHQLNFSQVLNVNAGTEISLIGLAHNVDMKIYHHAPALTMSLIPAVNVQIYEL